MPPGHFLVTDIRDSSGLGNYGLWGTRQTWNHAMRWVRWTATVRRIRQTQKLTIWIENNTGWSCALTDHVILCLPEKTIRNADC
jgi:hypothetical protein